jgi:hypothetical protein
MNEAPDFLTALVWRLYECGEQGPLVAAVGVLAAVLATVLLVLALVRRRQAFGCALVALAAGAAPLVLDAAWTVRALSAPLGDESPDQVLMGLLGTLEGGRALALTGALVPALVAGLLVGLGLSRLPRLQA